MKNKKLIGLASLMLVLGATGCPKETVETPPEKCEKHTWGEKVTIKEATCTEAGQTQRTCTVCGEKEDPRTVKALGHDWEDDATGGKAATCTEKGNKGQHCKRCSETRTVDIDPLGHKWVDDETGGVPATCEEAGSKNQHCERCDAKQEGVVVEALGHDYGEWATVEGKAPKCEEKGEEKRVCSRCNKEETREVAALGHKPTLSGEVHDPEPGKAAVRVYECANGCGQTFLGFKANEVSEESKSHLNFTEPNDKGEIGASFWGRPIGNSLALDSTGTSVNKQTNECVYCSTETGDFFEYVFDLDAEQAAKLATCRCYCDAKPADYLSGDFWAYNASADDWTPGFYIDGADEHVEKDADNKDVMVEDHARCDKDSASAGDALGEDHMVKKGKHITDYRYVLYVDDKIQQFDPDTKVTVEGSGTNTVRKEYEMPFTFHLKEGTNKISLRMAGGYRSTFYNFTFRPYVEKTPIEVANSTLEVETGATVAITGAPEGVTYTSDKPNVATVDENGVVTGVAAGTATITVAKEGNFKPAKVTVTVTQAANANVQYLDAANAQLTAGKLDNGKLKGDYTWTLGTGEGKVTVAPGEYSVKIDAKLTNSGHSGRKWYNMAKADLQVEGDATANGTGSNADKDTEDDYRYFMRVDSKVYNPETKQSWGDLGLTNTDFNKVQFVDKIIVTEATEKLTIAHGNIGYSLYVQGIELTRIGDHAHAYGEGTDVTVGENDAAVKRYECGCGIVKYEIAAATGKFKLAEDGSQWKTNPTSGSFKLDKKTDKSEGSSFTFTFALPKGFVGKMYQRGYMDQYSGNKNNKIYYQYNNESNIQVKVNGAENPIDMSAMSGTKFVDIFGDDLDGTNSTVKDVVIGDVTLGTSNTISYKRVQSLNMIVSTFVFVGTEVEPVLD